MTPEQTALLRKAEENIQAAQLLRSNERHDIAVSRAYYAMFYAAQALLLGEDLSFSKHSAVIAALGQRLVKTGRIDAVYHQYLREAQDQRNIADYGIGPGVEDGIAKEQIEHAVSFLSMAKRQLDPAAPAGSSS